MSFVAVVCMNDYPRGVTASFLTRDEAQAAGAGLRATIRQQWEATATSGRWNPTPFFHFYVFEQQGEPASPATPATIDHLDRNTGERTTVVLTERRKFERSDVCDRLEFVERRKK
jgi:hypothetical protein